MTTNFHVLLFTACGNEDSETYKEAVARGDGWETAIIDKLDKLATWIRGKTAIDTKWIKVYMVV